MTLEKAVEILSDILHYVKPGDPPDEHDAMELGIQALSLILIQRQYPNNLAWGTLPGETKKAWEAGQ